MASLGNKYISILVCRQITEIAQVYVVVKPQCAECITSYTLPIVNGYM